MLECNNIQTDATGLASSCVVTLAVSPREVSDGMCSKAGFWGVPIANHLMVLLQTNAFVFGAVKMRGMSEAVWELGDCCTPTVGVAGE